jgi:hypothetical protein
MPLNVLSFLGGSQRERTEVGPLYRKEARTACGLLCGIDVIKQNGELGWADIPFVMEPVWIFCLSQLSQHRGRGLRIVHLEHHVGATILASSDGRGVELDEVKRVNLVPFDILNALTHSLRVTTSYG